MNLSASADTYLLLDKEGKFQDVLQGKDWPVKLGNIDLLKGHSLAEIQNLKILKPLGVFISPALESFSDTGEDSITLSNSTDSFRFQARGIPHDDLYLVRLMSLKQELSSSNDITNSKKELILQRLEGFRVFGRGVSHDINNPLTYISSSQQRLRKKSEKCEMDDDFRKVVDQAVDFLSKGTEKIKDILEKVSWFAKIENNFTPEEIQTFNLKEMIEETWGAFDIADRLFIEMEISGDDVEFEGNREMMKQLFLELFLEAYQAMSDANMKDDLKIKIDLEKKEDETVVYVEDNGPGHDIEEDAKLFDPFRGRKSHNYGLGLSTAWKVANVHGGELELIVNKPGKVVFKISF